jgi:A/G-specific adenine glycosylase
VIEHYEEFLRRFPTLVALSLASEAEVLAAWSGLGYYRRARMLHKAAQFIVTERSGVLPTTAAELRTLPGIGDYTSAAIASIAFGESAAVVDGNVERVVLRLTGRPEESGAEARAFVRRHAQALMPARRVIEASIEPILDLLSHPHSFWTAEERIAIAAAAHPQEPAFEVERPALEGLETFSIDDDPARPLRVVRSNAAGDHNQAMMELGATICLPRAPLCLQCPVQAQCRTRGEHTTLPRTGQRSLPVAYLLETRKSGSATEVLLQRRPSDASLMPGMFELPPLPMDAVEGQEPALRLRHAITRTNYYVQVYAATGSPGDAGSRAAVRELRRSIPAAARDLMWVRAQQLPAIPLTGLARKILHRMKVMEGPSIELLK